MEKANLTPIRVALLCVTTLFLCNTAIAQQTFTVSEKVNVVGNECTKTFTCYYGDNDERIMHGLCKTEGKVKQQEDQYNKYAFSHIENINYSHGKKDGKYLFQQKIYQSHVDVYHDYQINRDKRMRRGWVINTEVTGNYKDDQRDGVWKETIVNRDTLGGEPTKDNKTKKYTYVFSNGKLIELTQPDGTHYTFRHVTRDGSEIPLLNGRHDKYTIKDGIIISHIERLNGDESPIDDELKQYIESKENLFDYQDELLGRGYVLSEKYRIGYKPYPMCEEFDYKSCTLYIIKKEQITYASIDDIEKYLSGVREKEFDEKLRELMASKHFWSGGKKYIKDSDLTELQSAVKRYKEMLAQIQSGKEQIANVKEKTIKEDRSNKWLLDDLIQSYGINSDFPFTTDTTKVHNRMKRIQECLKMEEDFYSYIVKGDKQKLIVAKHDSIMNIIGTDNLISDRYSRIYSERHEYSFRRLCRVLSDNHAKMDQERYYEYIKDVDEGLTIADSCLDYIRAVFQLKTFQEMFTHNPYFPYVEKKYNEVLSTIGYRWDGGKDIEYVKNNRYAPDSCWNGKENGDRLRKYIIKIEQLKTHTELLGTIDKNNERIVQLADKAKKIKKIYTNYYTNIQKEYSDNSLEYLNAIINNQNTLIAALEAEEPKNVDKKVKKGDAETMEDIIQIIKHQ